MNPVATSKPPNHALQQTAAAILVSGVHCLAARRPLLSVVVRRRWENVMKVKVFQQRKSPFSRHAKFALVVEQEINAWLELHPSIEIVQIRQSTAGGSMDGCSAITISIWYEEHAEQRVAPEPAGS